MENLQWNNIEGFEGCYLVSNTGIVKTVPRIIKRKNGAFYPIKEKVKKGNVGKFGYVTIALVKENKTVTTYLHRIIAQAFLQNPNKDKIINHKNGIKSDNRLENLEWCTSKYNNQHAVDIGLRKPKKRLITPEIGIKVLEMKSNKMTNKKIAESIGLSVYCVWYFLNN